MRTTSLSRRANLSKLQFVETTGFVDALFCGVGRSGALSFESALDEFATQFRPCCRMKLNHLRFKFAGASPFIF